MHDHIEEINLAGSESEQPSLELHDNAPD